MDGNGRWAKQKNKNRTHGHKEGMKNIFPILMALKKFDIKYVSMFCFSTENWSRPLSEVNYLMQFPEKIFTKSEQQKYINEGIKVIWVGRRNKVPLATKKILEDFEIATQNCTKLVFHICLDYGSFEELETCFKKLFLKYKKNNLNINDLTFSEIYENLYTKNAPPLDLLIRTGKEQRLSNFMLLQASYAELYFSSIYWPDFKEKDLKNIIDDYNSRDRRFGGIKDD